MRPPSFPARRFRPITALQPGTRRYSRLERRVLKVWPYAEFGGLAMDSLEMELAGLTTPKPERP